MEYLVYIICAPNSVDTGFFVNGVRYVSYHAGGMDLLKAFASSTTMPKFTDVILAEPGRVVILLVKDVREKENKAVIEGGGVVVRMVGDDSQGLYVPDAPDISDVAKVFVEEGLWGLRKLDEYDVEHGREPLLGKLLAYQVAIAEQRPSQHSILDHLVRREEAPYGLLIYARDVIGRRTVDLEKLVSLIETKTDKPRRLASVFRIIRPLRKPMTLEELKKTINSIVV